MTKELSNKVQGVTPGEPPFLQLHIMALPPYGKFEPATVKAGNIP